MNWVAHRDSRSLFERAWLHGIGSGIITPENQEAISREGTRAIRKIASVLGSENLRADLERAMRSMLGLVNLHLEKVSQGDIRLAARSIADNGLLFHTRGASNDIKRILAIRDGIELEDIDTEQKQQYEEAVVSSWAQYSFADFMQQYEDAERVRRRRDAAGAISQALQGEAPDTDFEPEQIIMTGLLIMVYTRKTTWIANQQGLEKLIEAIRKAPRKLAAPPEGLPERYRAIVETVWAERAPALKAVIVDSATPLHVLVAGDPSVNRLHELLVMPENALADVDDHDDRTTSHWKKLTGGTSDEARLLVIMLQGVLGLTDKLPFSQRTAKRLLDTVLMKRPDDRLIADWLEANAPHQNQSGLFELWNDFWDERESTLHEDASSDDYQSFATTWLPMQAPRKKPAARA